MLWCYGDSNLAKIYFATHDDDSLFKKSYSTYRL